jgi:hypothetical protein
MGKAYAARLRQYVADYKAATPCYDCGESFPFYKLDFDHVRGEKLFNISQAGVSVCSFPKVLAEIDKCVVVCKNCHAERTFRRNLSNHAEMQNDSVQLSD